MSLVRCIIAIHTLTVLPLGMPARAWEQTPPPARNGNIWDGRAHEPVPSEVQQQERAAGIVPSPRQQQATDDELERTYWKLLKEASP